MGGKPSKGTRRDKRLKENRRNNVTGDWQIGQRSRGRRRKG